MNVVYGLVVWVDIVSDDCKEDIDVGLCFWWVVRWVFCFLGFLIFFCLGEYFVI